MASVLCEIIYDETGSKTVAVPTKARKEFLQVPASFVRAEGNDHYLSVSFIQRARAGDVLVQLPFEADSGANRVWVPASNYQDSERVAV